jgi:hypothetical protein
MFNGCTNWPKLEKKLNASHPQAQPGQEKMPGHHGAPINAHQQRYVGERLRPPGRFVRLLHGTQIQGCIEEAHAAALKVFATAGGKRKVA